METTSDRMQIPEYVKRELSEVYLLMDHIAGRKDKNLDQALAAATTGGESITLEQVCAVAWPPTDQNRARTLSLVLTAKDRLSHAAYPASAYSIAFTYLSITPHGSAQPQGLRQRMLGHARRHFARHANSGGTLAPPHQTISGDRDGTDGSAEDTAVDEAATTSTMVQFARDAFPGLDAKREWLVERMASLSGVLLILLILTCLVSWDLAIGQRVLADYRWLSLHPEVMQLDPAQANSPCTTAQLEGGKSPAANAAPPPSAKDASINATSSKIQPGDLCARFLAGTRVLPIMERWISRQIVLAWFIHGTPPPEESPTYQGYVLELQRVLVTTLNYDVLPLVLGALAASAAAIRSISRKTAGNELEPRDLLQVWSRVLLGAFLGAVIGLLISPGASNGLFALVQGATGSAAAPAAGAETSDTVALSPAVYAFFAGFATGRIFGWLDNLLEKIFAFANPKP